MSPEPSKLAAIGPDYDDAKCFLDIMHPDHKPTFQTVPGDDADFEAKIIHGYLDDVWDELVEWNVRGANIYCMVNQGSGKGRSMHCVTAITAFFVSVRDAPMDRLDAIPIKPHMIVLTGPTSWQAHWKVIPKPFNYPSRFKAADFYKKVQMALALKVGGDPNCSDLARCCHVPGFFTYRDDESYHVELTHDRDLGDSISEINDVFPVS